MSRPYQIIPLVERTAAWWEWRRNGIGSADAATILGEKRAKSAERLLAEKQQPSVNAVERSFARGRAVALERDARVQYSLATGLPIEPTCVQSLARPWQRASLDGLTPDGERVVEIKCGRASYHSAVARQRVPRHHYGQLQHILAVTGLPAIDYWCYCPPLAPLRLEVRRDEAYIQRLLAAEEVFWRRFAPAPAS